MCRGDHWSPASLTQQCVVPEGFFTDNRARASNARPQTVEKGVLTLGPLCEGAPPAGGGGENCTAVRNISGYGKVLSLRPFGAPPSQREVFRHAGAASPLAAANRAVTKEVLYVQHHLGR